ncbi:MarR family winged helix-turn-helix transcriptional regulator [Micromonospora saelicesensis]|uniref:DNA-binding transcriptional regulator, MarR family n=1 Tax=Micromonospora saelicesensis TaxID=285676 RepID=A0A1C4VVX0_9ACTN|nr:MarR family transcriptional regulator [Micromonospora saelicesensis]SCE88122.1 DNA-binding transcriptional regulator, MarR family [Micromonospora saelicesensis]
MTITPDAVDRHIERWLPVLPDLDADVEGVVTRMIRLTRHLRAVKERVLVDLDLPAHEYDTLHALAGRGGRAAPSDLAADLTMAPASITARVDALLRRGFVHRIPSTVDRRRVDVELTEAGRAAWRGAMEVQGAEELRLLGALTATERRHLSDLLRRVLLVAEQPQNTPQTD